MSVEFIIVSWFTLYFLSCFIFQLVDLSNIGSLPVSVRNAESWQQRKKKREQNKTFILNVHKDYLEKHSLEEGWRTHWLRQYDKTKQNKKKYHWWNVWLCYFLFQIDNPEIVRSHVVFQEGRSKTGNEVKNANTCLSVIVSLGFLGPGNFFLPWPSSCFQDWLY